MIAIEPVVTEEKVRQLLAEATESESLDFKEDCDLRNKATQVELSKDIGAMQLNGGYLVVGADSSGRLTGLLTEARAAHFDEALVRNFVSRYLPEPLNLLAAHHTIDGHPVGIIYTGPYRDCLAIFKSVGQYRDAAKRMQVIFRPGDVFARHGSKSERWHQADVEAIRRCIASKEKEAWRRDLTDEIERIGIGATGQRLAAGPAASFTWRLDEGAFYATAIELLRANDPIPIRLLLRSAPGDADQIAHQPEGGAELDTLLNRLACLAATGEVTDQRWVVDASVSALGQVYDTGFRISQSNATYSMNESNLWLSVLTRVYAIGALAVREADWSTVRTLALRRGEPEGSRQYFKTWIRHGLTMAARSRLFEREEQGRTIELSRLSLALEVIREEACLRPDAAPEDERLLDSLCQFDILASLAAIDDAQSVDTRYFYTSFARFHTRRSELAVSRLLRDKEMRGTIFQGSDESLARALYEINRLASQESFRYAGWDGFTDPVIREFIEEHRIAN